MVIYMAKFVYGAGINDADYVVEKRSKNGRVKCNFYIKWKEMIRRCYSEKEKLRKPYYEDCTLCADWLVFSNFKKWMETQNWQGKQIDKDLLVVGNKIYSPETCCFVDGTTNKFTTDSNASRGKFKIGCYYDNQLKSFRARCSNPFTKKMEHLGLFDNELTAHLAWKKRKHELACQLADLQTDERVAAALRTRYLGDFTNA